jgi:hypothetical protein
MSCPKCEPEAKSRRWLWWVGIVSLVSAVGWYESSRGDGARATGAATQASHPPRGVEP